MILPSIASLYERLLQVPRRIRRLFYLSKREQDYARWFADSGDKRLRLEYPLSPTSVVFDVGGFEGQWASDIFARYCCRVHIFEPVPPFSVAIAKRFAGNPNISVHHFGLAASTRQEQIAIAGDASSIFGRAGDRAYIQLKCAREFLDTNGITELSLMKINIEGGEYELLEHLIATGFISNICHLQIQFHDFIPNAVASMKKIQAKLQLTHQLCWQYPFIWESWQRLA
jgi:FkbM family methyltransferase